jgi:hypothetical protein
MSDTPVTPAKAAARPAAEILADIEKERAALNGSFEALRRDLDEAIDAGRERARAAGKKAAVVVPAVAGVVASVAAAALLLRRRLAKKE